MFTVTSFLKPFGKTEDGEDFVGEVFWIQAEKENGERLAHFACFDGVEVVVDEEGINRFVDTRESAMAHAEHLLARIEAANPDFDSLYDSEYWGHVPARYGSIAWQWENF